MKTIFRPRRIWQVRRWHALQHRDPAVLGGCVGVQPVKDEFFFTENGDLLLQLGPLHYEDLSAQCQPS